MTSDFLDNLANHQYQKMHNEPMIKGDWRKVTNEQIVRNLVEKIEELLGGKAHYVECSDRTTYHQKIVIEFNHTEK